MLIDGHGIPSGRRRPGHPERLSDAGLVCLAAAQVLPGARSGHHWIRLCCGRLGHLFPYLPEQPGYHKRAKVAAPLTCNTILYLATLCPSRAGGLRLSDATPVPCGTSRQTAERSELARRADYGYCAPHSRFCWGLKLSLLTTAEGMPAAWCPAGPRTGGRRAGRARAAGPCRDIGALRDGMIVLADKGPAGREMERCAAGQVKVLLARPDRKDERRRFGTLGGMRQWTGPVNDTLKGQPGLERHGGRTRPGSLPAPPSGCRPWPPASGTTGGPAPMTSDP